MKILLISATDFEISDMKSNDIFDVLITGVGVPNTIFQLQKKLAENSNYKYILQIGFGGVDRNALHINNWKLGDLVAISKDAFGDLGAMENNRFKSVTDMGLSQQNNWLANEHLQQINTKNLPVSDAITCNTITDNTDIIKVHQEYWHADIESMEGAALHYVCTAYDIPFLQVRALSNIIGDRDKNNWTIKTAIENIRLFLNTY